MAALVGDVPDHRRDARDDLLRGGDMTPGDDLTLRADLQSLRSDLRGLRDLVDDRRQADKEAVAAALAAAEKAVNAALASAEKAAEKFDQSLKEYKTVSNEWRGTVEGLVVQLRELSELRQQLKGLEEKIADLRETRSRVSGQDHHAAVAKVDVAKWIGWLLAGVGLAWAVFKPK